MGNICKATTLGIVDTYESKQSFIMRNKIIFIDAILSAGVDIKQFRKLQVFNGEKNVDEIIGVGGFAVVKCF